MPLKNLEITKKDKKMKKILLMMIFLAGSSFTASAQFQIAYDNGENYSGWGNGDNNGFGFNSWSISYGANTGTFIGNPSKDGMSTTNIDTSAFGLYATAGDYVNALRVFNSPLQVGDIFTFFWTLNWDAGGGNKGFDFKAGGTTVFNVNNTGSAKITSTNGDVDTDSDYGINAMTVTLVRTSSTEYSFTMTRRKDGTTYSTTITSSDAIDRINLYIGNQNDGAGQKIFISTDLK